MSVQGDCNPDKQLKEKFCLSFWSNVISGNKLVAHFSQVAIFLVLICLCWQDRAIHMHLTSKFLFNFIYSIFLLRFLFKKRQDLLRILPRFTVNLRLLESWLVSAFDEVISSLNSGGFLPKTKLRIFECIYEWESTSWHHKWHQSLTVIICIVMLLFHLLFSFRVVTNANHTWVYQHCLSVIHF